MLKRYEPEPDADLEAPEPGLAGRLRIERRVDGQLWAARGASAARRVQVLRCFPWSQSTRFLSLRDRDEDEVALVRELSELDPDSRQALEEALVEAGFVLEIVGIERIEEEIEIRSWRVHTRQGPRAFQTPRDEWPRDVPGGGLVVHDVGGDLYWIREPETLDRRSQRQLWAFVD